MFEKSFRIRFYHLHVAIRNIARPLQVCCSPLPLLSPARSCSAEEITAVHYRAINTRGNMNKYAVIPMPCARPPESRQRTLIRTEHRASVTVAVAAAAAALLLLLGDARTDNRCFNQFSRYIVLWQTKQNRMSGGDGQTDRQRGCGLCIRHPLESIEKFSAFHLLKPMDGTRMRRGCRTGGRWLDVRCRTKCSITKQLC